MRMINSFTDSISKKFRQHNAGQRSRFRRQFQLETLESRLLFSDLPLLQQGDLDYLGAFRVPQGAAGASTFAYGGTAPAYNEANNSLFLVGHDWHQAVAEISIPPLVESNRLSDLNTASFIQPFSSLGSRIPNWTLESTSKIGGLEVVDGQLVGTFYEYYDGDANAVDSHFKLSSLNLSSGSLSGLHQVGNIGGGFVGGYMTPVPPEWQDELGMPYLTGQAALSIIGRTSAGPAAFGFDPDDLGNGTAPASVYVNYPLSHPLRPADTTNPYFNLTTEITGVVFPPNSSSVIFFGSHGTGQYCYGEASDCNDPARSGKGTHSRGGEYEYQAWAYDVHDFIDVKNGVKQSWEIQPYDVWTFDFPMPEAGKHIGGVSFDAQTGRLYVSQQFADRTGYDPYPIINVFQLPLNPTASQGPTLDAVRSTNVTENSATIQWNTNIPADSQVEYGTTTSLGTFSPLGTALVTNHSVNLSNLSADTTYHFRVSSRGESGVATVSATQTFTTLAQETPTEELVYSYANPKPLAPSDPAATIQVSNVSQLVNAVNNLQSGQTIALAPGQYNLNGVSDALYVPQGISNWSIRGASGDRNDVIIRGGGMGGSVRFGFWVGNSTDGTIADLTIDGVREHGIIANAGAHGMLYHGLRIIDSGDQFIKSNPSGPGEGNDRGVVEYSVFEYRTSSNNNYTNGVDVHGGDNWIVRYNLFKNILSPAGYDVAGPAVLFWNGSTNTIVDGNTFINSARGVSLGLEDKAGSYDHQGGIISNNMFYRDAGLPNAVDVPLYVADSPNTKIYHNTVFDLGGYPNAIEYRYSSSTNLDIRNNLINGTIVSREGASGNLGSNLALATAAMFVNAAAGDLHLSSTATAAINSGVLLSGLSLDLDGQPRDGQPDIGADERNATTIPQDQPPLIDGQAFAIDENSASGSFIGKVLASDPEGTPLTFSILSGNSNNAFSIDAASGDMRVQNAAALDFESRSRFELMVQVVDAAGLSGEATITIQLRDINEAPLIANQSFEVDEDYPDGNLVGAVVASDPEGQPLLFSILSGNSGNTFGIDAVSGALYIQNADTLDYETRASYELKIQVADSLGLRSAASVTILVTDVLEQANLPPVVAAHSFTINENLANGSFVGTVAASDPDGDSLTFSITAGNSNNAFAIDSASGVIRVNNSVALDFESQNRFVLSVRVADTAGLSSSSSATILLRDVDESINLPPVIAAQSFTIDENLANGSLVGKVSANDREGDALTYSITSGNSNNAFAIDSASGAIRVNNSDALDYETQNRFELRVRVVDTAGLGSSSTVTIFLRDVDERVNLPPLVAPQSFVVDENSGKGRLVGTVQASDPEATPLTYSILSGNSNNAFTIDRSSGVIRVQNTAALDHEARSLYQLTVQVADSSGLSSRATMTVHVDDVNEAPVVANQTFSMPAGVPVGYVVGSVAASDPDQGDVLTYTVTGGSVLGNGVVVNSRTGVITVSAPWPAGSVLPVITVRVSDQAGLSSSAWLTISVDAASDNSSETLVSHFAFDEGRGRSTYDQNNRRAQLDRPRWTTGVEGRGLRFDGRNDWVTVPDDDSLDLTRGMTMSMWVNPAKLGDWRTGILKERPGGLAYALYVSDDKSLPGVYINLGGWDLNATANQSLPLDTWSHLAATYDGSQLKLFVNGKQVAQLAARGSLVTSNSPLRFGGNSVWGEYFQGEMDEVRLYNSALSAADIARLAGSASSGSATAMRQQVQAVSAAVYSPQLSSTSAGSWGAAATSSLASNRGELLTTLADELRGSGATETQSAVRDRLVENWATATTRTEALAAVDAVLADASEDGARGRGGLESLDAFWERWR